MPADLHLHSTASDGALTPYELVTLAQKKGLTCIALTDHDSVCGITEAQKAGNEKGVEIIPGMEISCDYLDGEIHILGYYLAIDSPKLAEFSRTIISYRQTRAWRMVEKLNAHGYNIDNDEVKKLAGSSYIGRPHLAQILVRKGYVKDTDEAFASLLSKGKPGYVQRYKLTPHEAIELILHCGGVPVLAHPGVSGSIETITGYLVKEFIPCGIRGIEVYHSKHSHAVVEYYHQFSEKKNLLITGGSDCHGGLHGPILLGNIKLPDERVYALKEAAGMYD